MLRQALCATDCRPSPLTPRCQCCIWKQRLALSMFHFNFHLQATGINHNIEIGGDGGDDLDNTPNIRELSAPHKSFHVYFHHRSQDWWFSGPNRPFVSWMMSPCGKPPALTPATRTKKTRYAVPQLRPPAHRARRRSSPPDDHSSPQPRSDQARVSPPLFGSTV